MNDLTARYYALAELNETQAFDVHQTENSTGVILRPSAIKTKYRIKPSGEIPESEALALASAAIAKVHERARANYRERHDGCCFRNADGIYTRDDADCPENAAIEILHRADALVLGAISAGAISLPGPAAPAVPVRRRMDF